MPIPRQRVHPPKFPQPRYENRNYHQMLFDKFSPQATGGSSTGKGRFTYVAQGVIDKNAAARAAASKGPKAK